MEDFEALRQALGCLDLTVLPDAPDALDADAECAALVDRATTPFGAVAGICVPAEWATAALRALTRDGAGAIRLVSVANFPAGTSAPATVRGEIAALVDAGVDEVDVVLPWGALVDGRPEEVSRLLVTARRAAGDLVLKVILETGMLADPGRIREAADLAIDAGADFLKTSTGKVPVNATPAAAAVLLRAIREAGGHVGLKVSGGIRSVGDAVGYVRQAAEVMGRSWIRPTHFRIGASGVLEPILEALAERS